jgi:tetratricopeptide (TPR) repeat protein
MTGPCAVCGRPGAEAAGLDDPALCAGCLDLVDVPAALRNLTRAPVAPPDRLGKYRSLREIGRGAMGRVYEATDPVLGRRVALKVLDADSLGPEAVRRFLREARLLARVRHPNVVEIHELGRSDGRIFISMEFVDGADFPGPGGRDAALRRLVAVARALDHVHRQGVVHRDLKPSNLRVDPSGRPVLMDFGIARGGAEEAAITATGVVLGTPGYMAPEQLLGEVREADPRTDVYALGALLHEALTGRMPFEGSSVERMAARQESGPPPSPRALRRDVPPALDDLCRRAMARRLEDRPATAAAFAETLERALASPALSRRRLLAGSAGAALVAGVTALLSRQDPPPPPPAPPPAAAWLVEAGEHRARAGTGHLSFDDALSELGKAEALARRTATAEPRNAAAWRLLGGILEDRGRAAPAHEAYGRALAIEPSHRGTLAAQGGLVVTARLLARIDADAFPATAAACEARAAGLAPAGADPLAVAFRHVAAGRWTEAQSAFSALSDDAFARAEGIEAALGALGGATRSPARLPFPSPDRAPGRRGEPDVWIHLARLIERPSGGPPTRAVGRARGMMTGLIQPRARLAPARLRIEAAVLELRGDPAGAAATLGRAVKADPDYVLARLVRARLLSGSERAVELEAAAADATRLSLGAAALAEVAAAVR